MKFIIEDSIWEKFPSIRVGVIVVKGLRNNAEENQEILKRIHDETESIINHFSLDTITQEPFVARWREIYRMFGAKPSDYRSSIENLIRMALKGRTLSHINTLVDVYNVISLKYKLPVGGEDIDHMQGNLQLTIADGTEPPVTLLGDHEAEAPFAGEVLYRDDTGVICRCWNWREGQRTMLTKDTKNAVLVIEVNDPSEYENLEKALGELEAMVHSYAGGTTNRVILDKDNRSLEF